MAINTNVHDVHTATNLASIFKLPIIEIWQALITQLALSAGWAEALTGDWVTRLVDSLTVAS